METERTSEPGRRPAVAGHEPARGPETTASSMPIEPITPELALVDPELARVARAALPLPPDCLARRDDRVESLVEQRQPSVVASPTPRAPAAARGSARARGIRAPARALHAVVTAAAWVVLAGVIVSPLLAFLPPRQEPSLSLNAPTIDGAKQPNPSPARVLRWRTVPKADFYNLVLIRGKSRIDFWPTRPQRLITQKATARARRSGGVLPTGSYSWFVYPAFRGAGRVRYGPVVAHGVVLISPSPSLPPARRP